jgi:hypothetical protein
MPSELIFNLSEPMLTKSGPKQSRWVYKRVAPSWPRPIRVALVGASTATFGEIQWARSVGQYYRVHTVGL